jgi:hypothetical protein
MEHMPWLSQTSAEVYRANQPSPSPNDWPTSAGVTEGNSSEAYVHGVWHAGWTTVGVTRHRVGVSNSEVSRIGAALEDEFDGFRERCLDQAEFREVFFGRPFLKGRVDHQVVSPAVVGFRPGSPRSEP